MRGVITKFSTFVHDFLFATVCDSDSVLIFHKAIVCHPRMAQHKFHENCIKSVAMAMENVKITFMAITSVLIKIETSKLAYYVAYG